MVDDVPNDVKEDVADVSLLISSHHFGIYGMGVRLLVKQTV